MSIARQLELPLDVAADPYREYDAAIVAAYYDPAIRRWEHLLGRPAPAPVVPGRSGHRLNPQLTEWMMGLPLGWVTAVPGLSHPEQLRILGNGVVPQQAAHALRLLLPVMECAA